MPQTRPSWAHKKGGVDTHCRGALSTCRYFTVVGLYIQAKSYRKWAKMGTGVAFGDPGAPGFQRIRRN